MTTAAAAKAYEAAHVAQHEGRAYAVYNPKNRPVEELPVIYGFNNGGSGGVPYGNWQAVAIAEDGTVLGGHLCSSEAYMRHDLGIYEGTREDRHTEQYQKHYPDGYRMDFVSHADVNGHEKLNAAFKLNAEKAPAETAT